MNLACLAKVKETEFEYFAQDDFRCRKPDIAIEVRRGCRKGVGGTAIGGEVVGRGSGE